jgi:glycerophosphoryl diester phosphodiesterase
LDCRNHNFLSRKSDGLNFWRNYTPPFCVPHAEMRLLIEIGVDGIITDRPDLLMEVLNR